MIRLKNSAPKVLVVGDLMLDVYLWGKTERISPEAPVPVVEVHKESVVLGGAGNVISNLISLGASVSVASVIGNDESGGELAAMLKNAGVDTAALIRQNDRKTSRKTRLMATHQQVVRFDRESKEPIDHKSAEAVLKAALGALEKADICLLSDYGKGVLTGDLTRKLIAGAKKLNKPVLVDPKGRDYSKYSGATLVTPNRKEASEAVDRPLPTLEAVEAAGRELREKLNLTYAMITLSEAGMMVVGDKTTHIAARAQEVFDVTGAGDTVLAAMGVALASGLEIEEAAHFANTAAAVVVGKLGSATVTLDEIVEYDQSLHLQESGEKLIALQSAAAKAEKLRKAGKKIVFTNGCFDLLHRGHVEYLKASRREGDALFVGLNSDASVRKLKGESRPIVTEADRAYLLGSLGFVDYVIIFDDDTPLELVKAIRPDVLTKGADYAGKTVVGSDYAGRVVLVDLIEGRSTTNTVARIHQQKASEK